MTECTACSRYCKLLWVVLSVCRHFVALIPHSLKALLAIPSLPLPSLSYPPTLQLNDSQCSFLRPLANNSRVVMGTADFSGTGVLEGTIVMVRGSVWCERGKWRVRVGDVQGE